MREDKKECYKQQLFKYGFLTLVYLIEQYAEEENYEECQIILEALQETNSELKRELPTQWNEKAIEYLSSAVEKMTRTSGEIILNNIPYYADEIKREISQIKQ